MNKNLELFMTFAKIGAFTFGGGYAMIPIIQREVVDSRGWISNDEMIDMVAISQSTPGPLAINCATFTGYRLNGFFGALSATLGVVLPSFAIIIAIAGILDLIRNSEAVEYLFNGIQAGVVLLVLEAAVKMCRGIEIKLFSAALILISFVLCTFTGINVVWILLVSALIGLAVSLFRGREVQK